MPVRRSWAWDLESDPSSDIARIERARAEQRVSQPPINLNDFVRAVLDGVIGDIDLPLEYPLARFGEAGPDGLTDAQRPVFAQVEAALVARFRPLVGFERARLGVSFVGEWNRRAKTAADAAEIDASPMVSNPLPDSQGSFHTSDDRYFDNESDRRAHQKLLDERAERQAARVRARVGEGRVA